MIFECRYRETCEHFGILVDDECKSHCSVYESHRVEQLESLTKEILMHFRACLQDNKVPDPACFRGAKDQLASLGVILDD